MKPGRESYFALSPKNRWLRTGEPAEIGRPQSRLACDSAHPGRQWRVLGWSANPKVRGFALAFANLQGQSAGRSGGCQPPEGPRPRFFLTCRNPGREGSRPPDIRFAGPGLRRVDSWPNWNCPRMSAGYRVGVGLAPHLLVGRFGDKKKQQPSRRLDRWVEPFEPVDIPPSPARIDQ